jgi:hypothetical protein
MGDSGTLSNNGPAAVLNLTESQARFLLSNCNKNLDFARAALMKIETREAQQAMVDLIEQFKEIRRMLMEQGIEE